MLIALLLFSTLFLAYFNGANDNFKGVATLYGSGTLSYRAAISIATFATFAGSIAAIFLAQGLIVSFSGKGLVPQDVAGATTFLTAVSFGAGGTVLLATRLGFPISTTHSLVGGLLGAGLMSIGWEVNFSRMGGVFLVPLLLSPFIAFVLGASAYWVFTRLRRRLGFTKETCVCVGEQKQLIPIIAVSGAGSAGGINFAEMLPPLNTQVTVANANDCVEIYTDKVWGIHIQKILDFAHTLSAVAVSFARGLNDTPKIAGLLVAVQAINMRGGMVAIAVGMALGGLLNARRVAETMSNKITQINPGQGLSANLATSFLVLIASKFGVPVSTTHVSVGSIFGIGMVSGRRDVKVIKSIILSWLITLPVAMILSATIYFLIS